MFAHSAFTFLRISKLPISLISKRRYTLWNRFCTPISRINIKNKIFSFIRQEKTPKTKKKTAIGSLKMIDFEIMERSLKIACITRTVENSVAPWKTIPKHVLSQFCGLDSLVKCDYDLNKLNLDNRPEFYRTVLSYWQEFNFQTDSKEKNRLKIKSYGTIVIFLWTETQSSSMTALKKESPTSKIYLTEIIGSCLC